MRTLLFRTAALVCALHSARAQQSNLDPASPFAWSQNTGWVSLRYDTTTVAGGLIAGEYFLRGSAWGQNTGWINFGSGQPYNNLHYSNTVPGDCGVNHDGAGGLSGFAWAQNTGWINFGWAATGDPNRPRIDLKSGAFLGYAWGQNTGWINLATGVTALSITLADADGDGMDDHWETEHFAKPTIADATSDHDGDGYSDLAEFLAGTDPNAAASHLDFLTRTLSPNGKLETLSIPANPSRLYRVSRSTDLVLWEPSLNDWQIGEFAGLTFKESLDPGSDHRVFFRVEARRALTPP